MRALSAVSLPTGRGLQRAALGRWLLRVIPVLAFLGAGGLGFLRYLENFQLYRGYPAPRDAPYVSVRGSVDRFSVTSGALDGRRVEVLAYLPPGYTDRAGERFSVFYLLHGFPGTAGSFLNTVRLGVLEDELSARGVTRLPILVMPAGPGGLFGYDSAWANGVKSGRGWETFVAHDLVSAIDRRYATISTGSGRAIGGLSEGGFAALNIALHHPGEFRVVESWSGYELADRLPSVFGTDPARARFNSPLRQVSSVSTRLRLANVYFWFYTGSRDRLRDQNEGYAAELRRLHLRFHYFVVRGGHDWRLWRGYAGVALRAAIDHLARRP